MGMLVSVTSFAAENEEETSFASMQIMEAQMPAAEAFDRIVRSFPVDEYGNTIWPDEFAGEYVDKEREYKLVIKLTDVSEQMQEKYRELSGNPECLLFEQAQYSLNYLKTFVWCVDEFNNAGYPVWQYVASHRTNTFQMTVEPETYAELQKTDLLKRIEDFPVEVFPGKKPDLSSSSLTGGDRIYNTSSGTTMSIGIRPSPVR